MAGGLRDSTHHTQNRTRTRHSYHAVVVVVKWFFSDI